MKKATSRQTLSWQYARRKIINKLLSKPTGRDTLLNWKTATDAYGNPTDAVDQSSDWMSPVVQAESAFSAIRQMVDIMGKLGCNDLEELVHEYVNILTNN